MKKTTGSAVFFKFGNIFTMVKLVCDKNSAVKWKSPDNAVKKPLLNGQEQMKIMECKFKNLR